MLIHVGSENLVKIEAVELALEEYRELRDAEIKGIKVDSGVSSQPKNILETIRGAENRARNAFHECDYSVGLESGLMMMHLQQEMRYFEHTVCVFYDGRNVGVGFSPAFELPPAIAKMLLEENLNLEEACLRVGVTQNQNIGEAEGIVGILTKNIVDRLNYTIPAIQMALTRLQNPELYARRA